MEKRDIRFRAWDLNKKEWITHCDMSLEGELILNEAMVYEGDYILMQYTGLLDKNGKEIYESDLFVVTYSDLPNGFEYFSNTRKKKFIDVYAEVVFHNGKWTLKHKEPVDNEVVYGDMYKVLKDNPKEVIGNIFENPELLSKLRQ